MELKNKEIAKEVSKVVEKFEESNEQATKRIGEELRQAKKEEERKKGAMDMFFFLVGLPMTEHEYMLYMKEWKKRDTYNIKTFIRDRDLLKDLHLHELGKLEWGKTEDELRWHEKEIQRLKKELEARIGKERGFADLRDGDPNKTTIEG